MKAPLFEYPTYQYQIKDWDFKKKGLLKRLKEERFVRTDLQTFETDRQTNKKSYLHYFQDLIKDELWEFVQEAQVSCSMTDVWAVRYQKSDQQTIHNLKSWGFTGILYVEYDPKVHTPTCYVAPWQDPRSDTTSLAYPQNVNINLGNHGPCGLKVKCDECFSEVMNHDYREVVEKTKDLLDGN